MRVRRLHAFADVTPREAVRLQGRLAGHVEARGQFRRKLRCVAAADCSPSPDGRLHACVVVCAAPDWEVVEVAHARGVPPMPYVPGLLSFREAPIVLDALRQVRTAPDVLLVDGQGLAHPRGLGIATHLGLHVDVPTIGVGKSRLVGEHGEPGPARGDWVPLTQGRRRIGVVLRTRARVKPVYVSVGHRIGLLPAVRVVMACVTKYRLPQPIREADRRSRAAARATSRS